MAKSSARAARAVPPPRPVTSSPAKACPRWDTPNGPTSSGPLSVTFGTNLGIHHEVVLLGADGVTVVDGPHVAMPTSTGSGYAWSGNVTIPAGAGNYYLQVRVPGAAPGTHFSHTVELIVGGMTPPPLSITIVPRPGSEPTVPYPPGTWLMMDGVPSGGTPPYSITWLANGTPYPSGPTLSFAPPSPGYYSVTAQVQDSTGGPVVSSMPVGYTILAPSPLMILSFYRNPPGSVPAGTMVEFFATFKGGTAPYDYTLSPGDTTPPQFGSTSSMGEVLLGTHAYGTPGTYMATLTVTDATGATRSASVGVTIT